MKFSFEQPVWMDESEKDENEAESKEKLHQEIEEKLREAILKLIENKESFLGKGMTAEVHFLPDNPNLCFKIIRKVDVMARPNAVSNLRAEHRVLYDKKMESMEKRRAGMTDSEAIPWHVDLYSEAELLKKASESTNAVIIPKPYMCIHTTGVEEGDGYEIHDDIDVLLMDRLHALSIDDIIANKLLPPDNFNYEDFCQKVRQSISEMHDEKVYHRDLHTGNVMIDSATGKPCIIDFGRGARSSEEDAYVETPIDGEIIRFIHTDEEMFNDSAISFKNYLQYRTNIDK